MVGTKRGEGIPRCWGGNMLHYLSGSATIGWRVAYNENFAKNASQIAGNGTSQAL